MSLFDTNAPQTSNLPALMAKFPAPVPPPMPAMPDRTDLPALQSYGGDISTDPQLKALRDMAVSQMMQEGGGDASGPGQYVLPALHALAFGMSLGSRHGHGIGHDLPDLADEEDAKRMKHALAAGQLLQDLSGANASNEMGRRHNVDALVDWRNELRGPRNDEFGNFAKWGTGISGMERANATEQKLPDQLLGQQDRNALTNAHKDLVLQNKQFGADMQPGKQTLQELAIKGAGNKNTISGVKADAAKQLSDLDTQIKQQDLAYKTAKTAIEQFDKENGTAQKGGYQREHAQITSSQKEIDNNLVSIRQLRKLLTSPDITTEQADQYQQALSGLVTLNEDLGAKRDAAIAALPSGANQLNKPHPGSAALTATPTPIMTPIPTENDNSDLLSDGKTDSLTPIPTQTAAPSDTPYEGVPVPPPAATNPVMKNGKQVGWLMNGVPTGFDGKPLPKLK